MSVERKTAFIVKTETITAMQKVVDDDYRIYEPHQEKTCLCPMRTKMVQISLLIRAV